MSDIRTINGECIACGVCEPVCEHDAIHAGETEDDPYSIDAAACTGCADCEPQCPFNAIVPANQETVSLADQLRAALAG